MVMVGIMRVWIMMLGIMRVRMMMVRIMRVRMMMVEIMRVWTMQVGMIMLLTSVQDGGSEGVHDGGCADLSSYEPISEYDSPRYWGNTRDFDFSNPRFRVVDCDWRIHASLSHDGGNFMVKTLNDTHNCLRVTTNREATNTWLSTKVEGLVRVHPNMSSHVLKSEIKRMYGIDVSWRKIHRAKLKVVDRTRGSLAESYAVLPQYCIAFLASNPESFVKLHAHLPQKKTHLGFSRESFICLVGPRNEFLDGCRMIIGPNDCHTKTGAIAGIILLVIGIDGNNGIFHIAYSLMEAKSRDNWTWVLVKRCSGY
uniref:MULE transposase domain-containing protein n=1 Tax=Nelumbo nucifera TaxID=4432 RepID=A0A822Z6I0_NELNU|nr:TPA_asm: hypothetical protein HUJ06_007779 [Nelumbo nucifera]